MANRMVMQPIAIPASSFAWAKVSAIECGAFFTLALTETGGLFAWGQGLFGVLGQNNEDNRFTPTPVDTGDDQVAVIRAGAHHALYITGQGVAAALHGETPHRTSNYAKSCPQNPVTLLACIHLLTDLRVLAGELFTWGDGSHGALGLHENGKTRRVPTRVDPHGLSRPHSMHTVLTEHLLHQLFPGLGHRTRCASRRTHVRVLLCACECSLWRRRGAHGCMRQLPHSRGNGGRLPVDLRSGSVRCSGPWR